MTYNCIKLLRTALENHLVTIQKDIHDSQDELIKNINKFRLIEINHVLELLDLYTNENTKDLELFK